MGYPDRGRRIEGDGFWVSPFHLLALLSISVPHPIPLHMVPPSIHLSRHKMCKEEMLRKKQGSGKKNLSNTRYLGIYSCHNINLHYLAFMLL